MTAETAYILTKYHSLPGYMLTGVLFESLSIHKNVSLQAVHKYICIFQGSRPLNKGLAPNSGANTTGPGFGKGGISQDQHPPSPRGRRTTPPIGSVPPINQKLPNGRLPPSY